MDRNDLFDHFLKSQVPYITEIWVKIYDEVTPSSSPVIEINDKKIVLDLVLEESGFDGCSCEDSIPRRFSWYRALPEDLTIEGDCFPKILFLRKGLYNSAWYPQINSSFEGKIDMPMYEVPPKVYRDDVGWNHSPRMALESEGIISLKLPICKLSADFKVEDTWVGDFTLFTSNPEKLRRSFE